MAGRAAVHTAILHHACNGEIGLTDADDKAPATAAAGVRPVSLFSPSRYLDDMRPTGARARHVTNAFLSDVNLTKKRIAGGLDSSPADRFGLAGVHQEPLLTTLTLIVEGGFLSAAPIFRRSR
jgi:hypothetical protein